VDISFDIAGRVVVRRDYTDFIITFLCASIAGVVIDIFHMLFLLVDRPRGAGCISHYAFYTI
jgi:hypothetical protein